VRVVDLEPDAILLDYLADRDHALRCRNERVIRLAGGALRLLLEPHVEPHRRVERRDLVQKDVRELVLERLRIVVRGEVAARAPPARDRARDAADHLLDRRLALGRAELAAEVLLSDDVGRVLRPAGRELDALLLELPHLGVADLPVDEIERMGPRLREIPFDLQSRSADAGGCGGRRFGCATGVRHGFSSSFRLFACLPWTDVKGNHPCWLCRRTAKLRADRGR
jgi:hypothetical protein